MAPLPWWGKGAWKFPSFPPISSLPHEAKMGLQNSLLNWGWSGAGEWVVAVTAKGRLNFHVHRVVLKPLAKSQSNATMTFLHTHVAFLATKQSTVRAFVLLCFIYSLTITYGAPTSAQAKFWVCGKMVTTKTDKIFGLLDLTCWIEKI